MPTLCQVYNPQNLTTGGLIRLTLDRQIALIVATISIFMTTNRKKASLIATTFLIAILPAFSSAQSVNVFSTQGNASASMTVQHIISMFERRGLLDTDAKIILALEQRLGLQNSLVDPDGTWAVDNSGVWSNSANWTGGVIADGGGKADFSTVNITANRTVTIDTTSRTIGDMEIGDTDNSNNWNVNASGGASLIFDNTAMSANAKLNETAGGKNVNINAPVLLNSSLDITNGSSTNGVLTVAGNVSANTAGTKTITTSTGSVVISGIIGDGSGAVAVVQNGAGTLDLKGANTFSGGTTLNGGTLDIRNNTALGTGTFTINGGTITNGSGAAIALTNNNAETWAGDFTFGGGGGTGNLDTGSGAVTLTADRKVTAAGTVSSLTVSGVIGDGGSGFGLTKAGSGTLILAGANTYTGQTTVSAGTLLINGNESAATGPVVVNTGGTLGGVGTIGGAVTVHAGGTINPGQGGVGTLTLSSALTFSSAGTLATYSVDLSGATSDKLVIGGPLGLSGTHDQISFNGSADGTTTYVLATYASESGIFDTVTGLPANYTLVYGPTELDLTPIPEPGTWLAAALALAAVGYTQRKRFSGSLKRA